MTDDIERLLRAADDLIYHGKVRFRPVRITDPRVRMVR